MAELADAPDLGSGGVIHAGSSPVACISCIDPEDLFERLEKRKNIFLIFLDKQESIC